VRICALFHSNVVEITPDTAVVESPTGRQVLANDFVFALTGYRPDFSFLESMGVRLKVRIVYLYVILKPSKATCRASTSPV